MGITHRLRAALKPLRGALVLVVRVCAEREIDPASVLR
mgnify:FL=1|jgi:hypothetical protein